MKSLRTEIDRIIDHVEMHSFNQGYEGCLQALDEISNRLHNEGETAAAEVLRNAVKELLGESDD